MLDYIRYIDILIIDCWFIVVIFRFLFLVGGFSCFLIGGGWVSVNKIFLGMKLFCSEVGRGFFLFRVLLLFLSFGKVININV